MCSKNRNIIQPLTSNVLQLRGAVLFFFFFFQTAHFISSPTAGLSRDETAVLWLCICQHANEAHVDRLYTSSHLLSLCVCTVWEGKAVPSTLTPLSPREKVFLKNTNMCLLTCSYRCTVRGERVSFISQACVYVCVCFLFCFFFPAKGALRRWRKGQTRKEGGEERIEADEIEIEIQVSG